MIACYILMIVLIPVIAMGLRFYIEQLTLSGGITVIPHVLTLTHSMNKGIAFGLFQDGTVFFAVTTSIVIVVFAILLIKNYKKSKLFSVAAALIIGGGISNLIERVFFGQVFDYLSLSFFPPICNFADYCITAGTVCLIVYLLFFSDWMKSGQKKPKSDGQA